VTPVSPSHRPEPDWASGVTAEDDRALAAELVARLEEAGRSRSVSVTDLLQPRPAYYRATGGPLPPSAEREVWLEAGRRIHRDVGLLLARDGVLEARVHREAVHGRVDLLTDQPVELKSGGSVVDDPIAQRPDHVEQLAVYAAILAVPRGRLVYVREAADSTAGVSVFDLELPPPDDLWPRVRARAEQLTAALASRTPDSLPRCAWFGRGCDVQRAGRCTCTGTETLEPSLLAGTSARSSARADLAGELTQALGTQASPAAADRVRRFRELLYPRRTYFERTRPLPAPPSRVAQDPEGPSLWRDLAAAVELGPNGEVCRLPTLASEPDEEVAAFRGEPYLLRTTRGRQRGPPEEVLRRSPQYALELGLRCAVTGRRQGFVVLGYEFANTESDRVRVLRVRVDPTTFSRVWRHRTEALARAMAEGDPGSLPACPSWMVEECPYREACACGAAPPPSHR
jgi:hypothetical protein